MRINLKMLKMLFFVVFLFPGITNGQIADNQEEIDLTTISEKQREFLLDRAKYFRELENQKLSDLLCKNGKIGFNYRLSFEYNLLNINPCVADDTGFTKEILMRNLQNLRLDRLGLTKQIDRSEAAKAFAINRIEETSSRKIDFIRDKARRDSERATPSQREEILSRAERAERTIVERRDERIERLKHERETKIKSLENNVSALDSREKGIITNLMILSAINPDVKIDKNIKAQFGLIEREIKAEIAKKKIDSAREYFVAMNTRTSQILISETDDLFDSAESEVLSGNYIRISIMFQSVASRGTIDIPIETLPTKAIIKYRKCGIKNYKENKEISNTTLEGLPIARYKIRVIFNTKHRCAFYNGFKETGKILFDFDNEDEKICDISNINMDEIPCPKM